MTFRVGQKITMIAPWEAFHNPFPDVVFPEFGEVYTYRGMAAIGSRSGLYVFEIRNEPHKYAIYGVIEQPFPAENFRPVVERKTDITVFTEILRKVTRKSKADA